jgi:hypothetical protein
MNPAAQKKRLILMVAINLACFIAAGAAIVGHVSMGVGWLLPVFVVCILGGVAAQVWFLVGWAKSSRPPAGGVQ